MLVTVYRVENAARWGPYNPPDGEFPNELHTRRRDAHSVFNSAKHARGGLAWCRREQTLRFGFLSLEHLDAWFSAGWRRTLAANDYRIGVYAVDEEELRHGTQLDSTDLAQLTFNPRAATYLGDLPLTR